MKSIKLFSTYWKVYGPIFGDKASQAVSALCLFRDFDDDAQLMVLLLPLLLRLLLPSTSANAQTPLFTAVRSFDAGPSLQGVCVCV